MPCESEVKPASSFVILDENAQKVFWGQLISQACDKLMSVGMIWVLCTRFDPKWVPWFIALGALPHLIFSTVSAKWISRWGALPTVIWADLFRGALFLVAACLIPATDSDSHLLILLLVTVFASNIAGSLFNPAILSLPVDMMDPGERRDKLTALIDSCFSFGNVIGPLVSVAAYAATGLAGMLAINGLSYFFSAVLALGVKLQPLMKPIPSRSSDSDAHTLLPKSIGDILKGQPVISGMLITFLLMNFFLAPLMIFMPWYAKNVYGDGISALAKLEFFLAAGTVIGSTTLTFLKLPGSTCTRVALSLTLMAIAYLSFTFSHVLVLGCVSVTLLGFFLALANVLTLTFFQTNPKAEDVPAVMGMVNLISVASLPISMGIVGAVIDHVFVPALAATCAAIVILMAMCVRFIPGIRAV